MGTHRRCRRSLVTNSQLLASDPRGAEELRRVHAELERVTIAEEECQNKLWVSAPDEKAPTATVA
jgi:hypothetical protein